MHFVYSEETQSCLTHTRWMGQAHKLHLLKAHNEEKGVNEDSSFCDFTFSEGTYMGTKMGSSCKR